MNKVVVLSKVILKNSSNLFFSNSKKSKRQSKKINRILALIGLGFLYLYISGLTGFTIYSLTTALVAEQESQLLAPVLAILSVSISLFFGLFMMFSTFFTASDNHLWLPLPLKIQEIFTARFISTFVFINIIQMMFLFPAFIGFNIAATPGVFAYIGQFFVFVTIPIIMTSITYILILFLSRIINIQKYRSIFQVVTGSVIFILTFAISFFSSYAGQFIEGSTEDMALIVAAVRQAAGSLSWAHFLTFFTNGAFINNGVFSLLLPLALVGFAVILFFLAYHLSSRFYHASLYSVDISKKKKQVKNHQGTLRVRKPIHAFFINEVKSIFRSPTYVFNLLVPLLLVPLLMIGSFVATISSVPDFNLTFTQLSSLLFDPNEGYIFIIGTGCIAFVSTMNLISATAFTREGNNAQLLKIYPVTIRQILYGKMLFGLAINFIIFTPVIIVLGIIAKANVLIVFAYLVASVLLSLTMNYASILFDARFPMLNWTNEIEAAKNNKNVLGSMGLNFIITSCVFLLLIPALSYQLPVWILSLVLSALFLILIAMFEFIISKSDARLFKNIQ